MKYKTLLDFKRLVNQIYIANMHLLLMTIKLRNRL